MRKIIVSIIKGYQGISRQLWGSFLSPVPTQCRFHPFCSDYTVMAIEKYGIAQGVFKGLVRVLRCNPLSKGGIDLP